MQLGFHLFRSGLQPAAEVFLHFIHAGADREGRKLAQEDGFQFLLREQQNIPEGPALPGNQLFLPRLQKRLNRGLAGQRTLSAQHRTHRRTRLGGGVQFILQPGDGRRFRQIFPQQRSAQAGEGGLHHALHAQIGQYLRNIIQK